MRYDVAVVGAGPAGSLAAGLIAARGRSVLLIDRSHFPRPKVCGCCLNGRALAALAAAGLGELPRRLGAVPLSSVRLAAGRRWATIPLPGGVSLSRTAMDAALVDAAVARGVAFRPGSPATLGECHDEYRTLLLGDERVEASVIVAADGLGGTLAGAAAPDAGSRIGAGVVVASPEFYAPGTIYMTTGRGGYLGLVRLEGGRLDLACALDRDAVRRAAGPGHVAADLLDRAAWPVPDGLPSAPWRGTPPLTRVAGRVATHRLFRVGDAAGYVEPFTGEGMAWAMASAVALAPLAAQQWHPGVTAAWARAHRRIVTGRQLACRALAAVLRRPWLTGTLVTMLHHCPSLAAPLTRSLSES
jgi:flavin-dependent dehydrogenase